jgi:hypothetical protein
VTSFRTDFMRFIDARQQRYPVQGTGNRD